MMLLFVFLGFASLFGQEHDVYLDYSFIGNSNDHGIAEVNIKSNSSIGSPILFNNDFPDPRFEGPFDIRGKSGIRVSTPSVTITGVMDVTINGGLTGDYKTSDLSDNQTNNSFLLSTDYITFSAILTIRPKMEFSLPSTTKCYEDKINIVATPGHPFESYFWEYSVPSKDIEWESLPSDFQRNSELNVSLVDIFGIDNEDFVGETIYFRLSNTINGYSVPSLSYSWISCPPELINNDPIITSDVTCYGSNDGAVTLTFKEDIAPESQMRLFVYEGELPPSSTEENLTSESPEFPGTTKQTILDPLLTLTQTPNGYSGTLNGLAGNSINHDNTVNDFAEYFIVYQEVDYSVSPAVVKSGEITPSTFRIHQPTQVTLDTSAPNFFTNASCGNPAIFHLNNTARGGDNLIPGGSYTYQYSRDNGINWIDVEAPNNVLEIKPLENIQTIQVKGVYNANKNRCEGKEYQFSIEAIVPPVSFSNPSVGTTSTAEASDGSLRVEFSGVNKDDYTYSLIRFNTSTNTYTSIESNPIPVNTPGGLAVSFINLPIGTYRIIVINKNNCSQESPDLVVGTDPIPSLGTPVVTQMGCEGSYASISIPVSDFNDNYRYQWIINGIASAIKTVSGPNIVANIISTPGTHMLRVSAGRVSEADFNNDANTISTAVEINNPTTVTITNAIANDTQCDNTNDGSIILTISGGSSYEYTMEFFPTETDWIPLTDNTITDLGPGSYRVTIRNQDGCESETLQNIIVETAPSLVVTTTNTDATTNGGSQGSINLSIIGGTPFSAPNAPYTISWYKDGVSYPDSDLSTPNFINELAAGAYSATVTDANGCINTISITITEPGPLTILNFTGTDTCSGLDNGTLTATAQGTGQLIFNWMLSDGSPTGKAVASTPSMDGTATVEGLSPGSYSLNIIESDSGHEAISTQDVIISQASPITATILTTESSCGNPNSGTIAITDVSGGTPFPIGSGYEYHINDAFNDYQSDPVFNNLPIRNYIVTVRDASGCVFSKTVEITQASSPVLDQTNTILTNPTSVGGTDGAITLAFIGDSVDYSYQWTGPGVNEVATKDITGLVAGNYQVSITNPDNCSLVTNFTINDPSPLQVTITQTVLLECNGDDFGEITATIKDGTAPYSYEWFQITNGNTIPLSEDTGIIEGLSAGTYFLRATDANNNTINTSPLTITQPDSLTAQVDEVTDVLCSGELTGAINVSVSGGTAPYSYIWSDGTINQNLKDVAAGKYTLEIMDANACFTEITATVNNVSNSIQITNVSINNVSDHMGNNGSISVNIVGGASPYNLAWTRLSDNTDLGNQELISNLSSDIYQVSVTDANGCSITEAYEVNQPDIVEETIVQLSCYGDSDGSISVLVNQGNGNYTYNWNTGATTNIVDNLKSGSYTVTITGFGDGPLTRTYILEEPLPLEVDLGESRTLCGGQELVLDASVSDVTATYAWTSNTGFTSSDPIVTIKKGGTYTISISTQNGCSTTGSILVMVNDEEISAEFAMSSQVFVGESLIAVDISFPLPQSQEWIIPQGATIVKTDSDETELIFIKPGEYEIGIITQIGDCIAQQFKKVLVVTNENKEAINGNTDTRKKLEEFLIYPNPTNGRFTADIALSARSNISIKVYNFANNALMASKKERGSDNYSIPLDISGLPAGVYAVVLETPFGNSLRKVILK